MAIPSGSSPVPRWKYDVFLSFRGEDTRRGFVSHLYHELQYWQTIKIFKDDPELEIGASISPELLSAIEESHLAIVVLSPNYASSTWCLDELAKIVESMETKGENTILPVFFNVDPCDVRYQRGSFAQAFAKHEERFSNDNEKVKRWRTALRRVANLSGWDSKNYGCEREIIKDVVRRVWSKVHPRITLLDSTDKLVGIDFGKLDLLLAPEVNDVRFIGIWGMGGVGKTTLAKLVFERISHHFEVSQFLVNVRDVSARHGTLVDLQKQLLFPIMKENIACVWNEEQGTYFIKKFCSNKKVLLVVDDIDQHNQLKLLVGNRSWFGEGSRIIVTTRDERILIENDIDTSFKVNQLNHAEALQLFSQNAFRRDEPEEDFLKLSECFVGYAKGLPLALTTMGRYLYKRNLHTWSSALDKLKKIPSPTIFDSLRLSYDPLDDMEKNIFLDIAFFYKGMEKGHIIEMVESCGLCGLIIGIDVLIEKSLLTVGKTYNNVELVEMHDLIQEMAKEIVRRESPNEPGRRSRLCHRDDIFHIFQRNTGTEAIKGIKLCLPEFEVADSSWTNECFSKMPNLTYLEFHNLLIPSSPKLLPNSLRSLQWSWYPSKSLPASYLPNSLVELKMNESKLVWLWDGKLDLPNLKYMDLSRSRNLTKTPDFTGCPKLENLDLSDCTGLVEIHPTIAVHKKIKILNLKSCHSLQSFPSEIDMDSLQDFRMSYPRDIKIPNFTRGVKNLSVLELCGCTIEREKTSLCSLALRSIGALRSLTSLSICNAKLYEGALPDDIGQWLLSLTDLDLSGNDFESLPSSIKFLSALENFNIKGCRRLKRLPDLPSNARLSVEADDCDCLEFLSEPSHLSRFTPKLEYFSLSLLNCFYLDDVEGWNTGILWMLRVLAAQGIKDSFTEFTIVSPGNEISEWFDYQSQGNSLTIALPSDVESCASKWMGVAVCALFSQVPDYYSLVSILCSWQESSSVEFDLARSDSEGAVGNHVLVFYIHRDRIQDCTTFPVNFLCEGICWESEKMIYYMPAVHSCGARLVYERDLEELFLPPSRKKDVYDTREV